MLTKPARQTSAITRLATGPRATYRIQLHGGFTFHDATAVVPYLAALGVSHLYCSPYFRARPGSTHGYDVVDHNAFNPEIGTQEDFELLVTTLRAHDMTHIADFVPNHVGIMGAENRWWMDVLEQGQPSPYAQYFDIDWEPADPQLKGKVLVPILGDYYGAVLERGELQLRYEEPTDSFAVYYFHHRFPINKQDAAAAREVLHNPSADALHELLERQAYRLAHWRLASDEVNYRRFFDVNDLAALRMENDAVFEATHGLLFELLRANKIGGLRIDHPDGLYDPARYFQRLQERFLELSASGTTGPSALYVLAEKITAHYEHLPTEWPLAGTTGYDFLNLVNGIFVDRSRRGRFDRVYRAFTEEERPWEEILRESKHLILRTALAADVTVLANQLHHIAHANRHTRDFSLNALRQAIRDVIASFPVYRTYVAEAVTAADERYLRWATTGAKSHSQAADVTIYDFMLQTLLTVPAFTRKFQQVTAPAAAKGMEDTAFYRFSRLLSLNEVGGDPNNFGVSLTAFHRENLRRARDWPNSLLASSTHDTKRSEDVRARINVLSELPSLWREVLVRWRTLNRSRYVTVDGQPAPSMEEEYLLYQTLVGSWPLERPDTAALAAYRERITQYAIKAAREAKMRTSWANVNEAYEQAVAGFIAAILDWQSGALFLEDLHTTAGRIARLGLLNSLSQTLLKLTCPGVPDIYQGNEVWDFSLVDPDNRRAVDFQQLATLLGQLSSCEAYDSEQLAQHLAELWHTPGDGRPKLYLIWRVLSVRRRFPELFSHGRYIALQTVGKHAAHICAFARAHLSHGAIAIVPRLLARILPERVPLDFSTVDWQDTAVVVKPNLKYENFKSALDGRPAHIETAEGRRVLPLEPLLKRFPVSLLIAE